MGEYSRWVICPHGVSGITPQSDINQSYLAHPCRNHNNCPHLTVRATDLWQMLPVWLYRTVHTSVTHNTPSGRQGAPNTLSDRTQHRLHHLLFSVRPGLFYRMQRDSMKYLKHILSADLLRAQDGKSVHGAWCFLLYSYQYEITVLTTSWWFGDDHKARVFFMMTSSNANIFRVTGSLCGEFTGHRWIPRTKVSDAELWCFFDLGLNKRLHKQSWGRWFETPSRSLWRNRRVKSTPNPSV